MFSQEGNKYPIRHLMRAVFLCLLFGLIGCAGRIQIPEVQNLEPLDLELHEQSHTISLSKVVSEISIGQKVGFHYGVGQIYFNEGFEILCTNYLQKSFYNELESAGYAILNSSEELFSEYETKSADILIGAKLIDFRYNRIAQLIDWKFEDYIKINWQVYSRAKRKVIYNKDSEGCVKHIIKEWSPDSNQLRESMEMAILASVNNLLADPDFHEILIVTPIKDTKSGDNVIAKTFLPSVPLFTATLSEHSNQIRSSVVTIKTNSGHGSGFFISKEGHILTNAHVVGDEAIVRIKLATGREILGDVICRDRSRDVALIKAENDEMIPLPIQTKELQMGSKVYAMGSPLDESLGSTLTKGIVSALRKEDGLEYIQSDVSIQKGNSGGPLMDKNGNVIGISVKGKYVGEAPMGLNFFVPIKDALSSLGIVFK